MIASVIIVAIRVRRRLARVDMAVAFLEVRPRNRSTLAGMKGVAFAGLVVLVACSSDPPPQAVMVPAPTPSVTPSAAPPPPPVVSAAPPPSAAPVASEEAQPMDMVWGDPLPDPLAPAPASSLGRLGSSRGGAPSLRQGAVMVNGKLPTEVIQRIIRQNFGRFRLCYENGLRTNAKLAGRVTVKFTIEKSGAVVNPGDGGSDLPDKTVIGCVVKGFSNLSFPSPASGIVNVTYPIIFAPPSP